MTEYSVLRGMQYFNTFNNFIHIYSDLGHPCHMIVDKNYDMLLHFLYFNTIVQDSIMLA